MHNIYTYIHAHAHMTYIYRLSKCITVMSQASLSMCETVPRDTLSSFSRFCCGACEAQSDRRSDLGSSDTPTTCTGAEGEGRLAAFLCGCICGGLSQRKVCGKVAVSGRPPPYREVGNIAEGHCSACQLQQSLVLLCFFLFFNAIQSIQLRSLC